MAVNKKFLTPVDISLLAASLVFTVAGVAYAGLSGVATIPGVKPILQADIPTTTSPRPVASTLPSPSPTPIFGTVDLGDGQTTAPVASPTLESIPETSPEPSAAPTVETTPTPEATPTPAPAKDAATQIQEILAGELMPALVSVARANNGKFPVSASFRESFKEDAPWKQAIAPYREGKSFPTLPANQSGDIGYKSDGNDCELTAPYPETKSGSVLSVDPNGNRVSLLILYCRDYYSKTGS